MKRKLIRVAVGLLVIAGVVGGVVYWEWPRGSLYHPRGSEEGTSTLQPLVATTSSFLEALPGARVGVPPAGAAPAVDRVIISPDVIPAAAPTQVVVLATITDPSLIQGSVNLLQLDQAGKVVANLGSFSSVGSNNYRIQVTLNRATPGVLNFQISAAFRGLLKRVFSERFSVVVVGPNDVTLTTPPGWQVDPQSLQLGGPVSLNNFNSNYSEGGIIPRGGADITITRVPLPPPPLSDYINDELSGTTIESTDSVTVAGSPGTRVRYTASFTSTFSLKYITIYVAHGALLYKLTLSYTAGDPSELQFLSDFQQVLNTVNFNP